jgi:AcrR family transcriptional regulator
VLAEAVVLFAARGFDGVSVRDLAQRVGISAPTLYHHFPDKQSLYVAAVERAFAAHNQGIVSALARDIPPRARLRHLVETFAGLAAGDETFRKLVLRELLDGDDARLAVLAAQIFSEPHGLIVQLARETASDLDPYLLVNSLFGMVLFGIQAAPLRRHLPGEGSKQQKPSHIADHVATLLERAGDRGRER